jgi:hypothetical protein
MVIRIVVGISLLVVFSVIIRLFVLNYRKGGFFVVIVIPVIVIIIVVLIFIGIIIV